jgi:hypothetical protein
MAFFTFDEVRQAAASATGSMRFASDAIIAARAETLFESRAAEARRVAVKHFDIFLSHAYSDKIIVAGLFSMLTATGFSVYVDWIHDRHRLDRNNVTPANAAILRERMHQCDALFYATTRNHTASKWMPWECGYFDGFDSKTTGGGIQAGHVAILPVMQSAHSTFSGQEYLGVYPIAQNGTALRRNVNIHNQLVTFQYLHFDKWIQNGHP